MLLAAAALENTRGEEALDGEASEGEVVLAVLGKDPATLEQLLEDAEEEAVELVIVLVALTFIISSFSTAARLSKTAPATRTRHRCARSYSNAPCCI